jgi:hypothetical protein
MAFIYSRAVEVLVWLGSHKPPDTMDKMKADHWREAHKVSPQEAVWMPLEPFVYRLIHEEYWKRAWIIQEIGMASTIKVLIGTDSLPWTLFLELVRGYQTRKPTDGAASRILRLGSMRESKYAGGETYSLSNLLDAFRDCFCSVQHDKLYAFLGMANDHFTGDIPVDYNKSTVELYQDTIRFQSRNTLNTIQNQIEMVYFSGLVQRLFDRESGLKPKDEGNFLFDPQGKTWISWWATNQFYISLRDEDKQGNVFLGVLVLEFLDRLLSFVWKPKAEYTMFWHASSRESASLWGVDGDILADAESIKVRGVIASRIDFIGPRESDILGTFDTKERWRKDLVARYPYKADQNKAHGRNERLMNILEHSSPSQTRDIIPLERPTGNSSLVPGSRIFLGSNMTTGIIPSNARIGDYICQFWGSSASAVLRRQEQSSGWGFWKSSSASYEIIGRAGIVKDGDGND